MSTFIGIHSKQREWDIIMSEFNKKLKRIILWFYIFIVILKIKG